MAVLERAHAELDACGAAGYRDEATHELRALGRRVGRFARPAATGAGLAALTDRERAVGELVAGGYTNRGIAGTLFLTEKTVEGHLSQIFAKLGVPSRAAVAAVPERDRTATEP